MRRGCACISACLFVGRQGRGGGAALAGGAVSRGRGARRRRGRQRRGRLGARQPAGRAARRAGGPGFRAARAAAAARAPDRRPRGVRARGAGAVFACSQSCVPTLMRCPHSCVLPDSTAGHRALQCRIWRMCLPQCQHGIHAAVRGVQSDLQRETLWTDTCEERGVVAGMGVLPVLLQPRQAGSAGRARARACRAARWAGRATASPRRRGRSCCALARTSRSRSLPWSSSPRRTTRARRRTRRPYRRAPARAAGPRARPARRHVRGQSGAWRRGEAESQAMRCAWPRRAQCA
jgi:hypothetical protein